MSGLRGLGSLQTLIGKSYPQPRTRKDSEQAHADSLLSTMPQQQQVNQKRPRQSAPSPAPQPAGGPQSPPPHGPACARTSSGQQEVSFETLVVGGRHRRSSNDGTSAPTTSTSRADIVHVVLEREPGNPADSNAILVQATNNAGMSYSIGHIPRSVAEKLAPLMDWSLVELRAEVVQQPTAPKELKADEAPAVPAASSAGVGEDAAGPTPEPCSSSRPPAGPQQQRRPPTLSEPSEAPCGSSSNSGRGDSNAPPTSSSLERRNSDPGLGRLALAGGGARGGQLGPVTRPQSAPQAGLRLPCNPSTSAAAATPQDQQPLVLLVRAWPTGARGMAGEGPAEVMLALSEAAAAAEARGAASGQVLRQSFEMVVQQVRSLDSHLLSAAELSALDKYQELSPSAQCLLLRLYLRKGPWFVVGQLAYPECPDLQADVDALLAAGLVGVPRDDLGGAKTAAGEAGEGEVGGYDWSGVLHLLPVAQVRQMALTYGFAVSSEVASNLSKADLVQLSVKARRRQRQQQARQGAAAAQVLVIDWAQEQQEEAASEDEAGAAAMGATRWELGSVEEQGMQVDRASTLRGGAAEGGVPRALGAAAEAAERRRAAPGARPVLHSDGYAGQLWRDAKQHLGTCIRLDPDFLTLVGRMQRVYFLNEAQDLSRFLANQRGATPYPQYTLHCSHSAFPSRQALLSYERALQEAVQLDDAISRDDPEEAERCLQPARLAIERGQHRADALAAAQASAPGRVSAAAAKVISTAPAAGAAAAAAAAALHRQTEGEAAESRAPTAEAGLPESSSWEAAERSGAAAHAEAPSISAPAAPAAPAAAASPPASVTFLSRFCAAWVYAEMCTVAVSILEKQRRYAEASDLLHLLLQGACCPSRRGDWWLRMSIDLEHKGDIEAALLAAEAALDDRWVRHGDLLALQRRVLRLGKPPRRWRRPRWAARVSREPPEVVIAGRPTASVVGVKSRFYSEAGHQVSVESLALEYYASEEAGRWQGMHTEGGVWATLFGLLMWDVLMAPLPDVFRTPFQTAPLDLTTEFFYPARRDLIDSQLTRIASGEAPELLQASWSSHFGEWCRGVNWERYELPQLLDICRCVGPLGLSVVCRMLAEDYSGWCGGMPDLLLWRPSQGDAKLSEVKGPRDRLSEAQRAWMLALIDVDLRCEVLRVQVPKPEGGGSGKKGAGLIGVKRERDVCEAAGKAAMVAGAARRPPPSPLLPSSLASPPAQQLRRQKQQQNPPEEPSICMEVSPTHAAAAGPLQAAPQVACGTDSRPTSLPETRPRKWQQRTRQTQAEQPPASGMSRIGESAAQAPSAPDLEPQVVDLTDTQPPPGLADAEQPEAGPTQEYGTHQDCTALPPATSVQDGTAGKGKRKSVGARPSLSSTSSGLHQSSLLSFFNRRQHPPS